MYLLFYTMGSWSAWFQVSKYPQLTLLWFYWYKNEKYVKCLSHLISINSYMSDFESHFLSNLSNGKQHELTSPKRYIGFYFSAHWCPPCQRFTPQLIQTYEHIKDQIEIIYVSSDRTSDQYDEYYGKMPWLAYRYGDPRISEVSTTFGVRGIPNLHICTRDGNIVTTIGVQEVTADPTGKQFPWKEKKIKEISTNSNGLNEYPSVVILAESEGTDYEFFEVLLDELENKLADCPLKLFYSRKANPISQQIGALTGRSLARNQVLLIDCADDGGYYVSNDPMTVDSIIIFIERYLAGSITRQQMVTG